MQCLEDVAGSEMYIGIFAWRYGYIPDNDELNPSNESITALEYRKARELDIPTLIFILKDGVAWPPDLHDGILGADHGEAIRNLREELEAEHLVAYFSDEKDLALQVVGSLFLWEKERAPVSLSEPVNRKPDDRSLGDATTWGIRAIGATSCSYTGEGITVAVLSTGVDTTHEAFSGVEFCVKNFTEEENVDDTNGLGTHTAGTIFGRDTDGRRIGVAPGISRVLVAKVFGGRGWTMQTIFDATKWAVKNGAQIVSCDLGIDIPGFVRQLTENGMPVEVATSRALEMFQHNTAFIESLKVHYIKSALFVCPVGNESKRDSDLEFVCGPTLPARLEGYFSVAALEKTSNSEILRPAGFSNSGADISAPGVDILSAAVGGGLAQLSGTSIAANHVVGIAALWAEKQMRDRGEFDVIELVAQLRASANTQHLIDGASRADIGSGLVKAPMS